MVNLKTSGIYIILFLVPKLLFGQFVAQEYFKNRRLGPILMESTFFLFGPAEQKSTGTAFILAHTISTDTTIVKTDSTFYSEYKLIMPYKKILFREVLVTAAHILKEIEGEYAYLWLRRKDNNIYIPFAHKIRIRDHEISLWKQPNSNIDVAVLYVDLPDNMRGAFKILTERYLATDSELDGIDLNAGDDLLCLGFPHNTFSNEEGFPILRSGKFSSFRGQNVKETDSFLFDFQIYPGNSGGPVYVDLKNSVNSKGEVLYTLPKILGVVSKQLKSVDGNPIEVAKIIPAKYIIEAISNLP